MRFKTAFSAAKISTSQIEEREATGEERSLKGEYSQKFPLTLWLHVAVSFPPGTFFLPLQPLLLIHCEYN